MTDHHNNNAGNGQQAHRRTGPVLDIRQKIALGFSLLLLVVITTFWLLFQNGLDRTVGEYTDTVGNTLAGQTALAVRELVLTNDLLGLNVVLTQLIGDQNIRHAEILDVDGNVLASAGQPPGSNGESPLTYSAPISVQDAVAGSVRLELNNTVLSAQRMQLRNLFLAVLGVSLILVITAGYAIGGHIASPLRTLVKTLRDHDDGGDDIRNNDETGQLERAVERLLERFRKMEDRLRETGTWQNDKASSGKDPARLSASTLIIKVVNLNTAIELLHPVTLTNLLREYVFYLNQAARLYGGSFHRQSGESAMLCFDSAHCREKHSINAIHCAGLFQEIMRQVNDKHKAKGHQSLEFHMSIHSGDIFLAPRINAAGKDGAGTDAVLGLTVDIARFLCNQSNPGELVLSETTCSQAREFEAVHGGRRNEFTMPADNMSFMAYILDYGFAEGNELIRKQCRHILRPSE